MDARAELDLNDERKGPCRFCGSLNSADYESPLGPFDCCDPTPPRSIPDDCVTAERRAEREAWRAELASLRQWLEIRHASGKQR